MRSTFVTNNFNGTRVALDFAKVKWFAVDSPDDDGDCKIELKFDDNEHDSFTVSKDEADRLCEAWFDYGAKS